ncbi:hypothetical protein K435DRAFT_610178, partial [Dendrothele bispora CBS 962.96]
TPTPISTPDGRIFVVLVGRPRGSEWGQVADAAAQKLEETRSRCSWAAKQLSHRRGNFLALTTGISYGGGQIRPGNLVHNRNNAARLAELVAYKSFQRMSGFANG